MSKKMLVDASHPEETRVVVVDGNRVEEFDYESASRRQLKGNIYLAKVTRVEPSLQACFVEYGGNRHGFLAFSEIHPDYYQIPTADRQALIEATRASERHDDDDDDGDDAEAAQPSTQAASPSSEASNDDHTTASPSEPLAETDSPGAIVEVASDVTDDVWVHDPEEGSEAPADGDSAAPNGYLNGSGESADEVSASEFTVEPDTAVDTFVAPEAALTPSDLSQANLPEAESAGAKARILGWGGKIKKGA